MSALDFNLSDLETIKADVEKAVTVLEQAVTVAEQFPFLPANFKPELAAALAVLEALQAVLAKVP